MKSSSSKSCKAEKSEVRKHVKSDIGDYKEEIRKDKSLLKSLKPSKAKRKK